MTLYTGNRNQFAWLLKPESLRSVNIFRITLADVFGILVLVGSSKWTEYNPYLIL